MIVLWLVWTAFKLQNPVKHSHLYIDEAEVDFDKLYALESEHIAEWYINETEKVVVIKYVTSQMQEDDIKSKISK